MKFNWAGELAVGREITSAALQHEASDDRIKPLQGVEMILKKAVYEVCTICGEQKRIKDEMYCCDNCLKELEGSSLELTKYSLTDERETFHFCSWECFFKKAPDIKADFFMALPYLHGDTDDLRINAEGFWNAVRDYGKERINTR